jgi:hypothetical protein
MEPKLEEFKSLDFLDERVRLSLDITNEAFDHLPEVTQEDLAKKTERYRALLGRWDKVDEESVKLIVEAVLQDPEQVHYSEQEGEVHAVNIPSLQLLASSVKKFSEEFSNLELVGEIHTHPTTQDELDPDQRPWMPSVEDKDAMMKCYDRGELGPDRPFVFGIAAPMSDGKTGYKFYRVVKVEDGYKIVVVE